MNDFAHVTERHARRLLVASDPPSHAILDLAYQAAVDKVRADETNPTIKDWHTIDARWGAIVNLAPGCTIAQRMRALREFWGIREIA